MKVITAPIYEDKDTKMVSVFLAGGITNCPKWQDKVIDGLKEYEKDYNLDRLVLYNPRRENFPIEDKNASREQIKWEFEHIENCDIFSMYFTSGESDQPICLYELGRNILRMQMRYPTDWEERIIISMEDWYKRKQDVLIQTALATNKKVRVNLQGDSEYCLKTHIYKIFCSYNKLRNHK